VARVGGFVADLSARSEVRRPATEPLDRLDQSDGLADNVGVFLFGPRSARHGS
jgi:hypothetical protein